MRARDSPTRSFESEDAVRLDRLHGHSSIDARMRTCTFTRIRIRVDRRDVATRSSRDRASAHWHTSTSARARAPRLLHAAPTTPRAAASAPCHTSRRGLRELHGPPPPPPTLLRPGRGLITSRRVRVVGGLRVPTRLPAAAAPLPAGGGSAAPLARRRLGRPRRAGGVMTAPSPLAVEAASLMRRSPAPVAGAPRAVATGDGVVVIVAVAGPAAGDAAAPGRGARCVAA
jgi:hypothetical protein